MVKPFQHTVIVGHNLADTAAFCVLMETVIYGLLVSYMPAHVWLIRGNDGPLTDDTISMELWFDEVDVGPTSIVPWNIGVRPTLDERLEELAAAIGDRHELVVVACTWEEQDWTRFAVRRLFPNSVIVPIHTGRGSLHRLLAWLAFPIRFVRRLHHQRFRPIIRTAPAQ